MKKFRRFLCLTVAAFGCVSCASLTKDSASDDGGDSTAATTAADPAAEESQDALMIIDVKGAKRNVVLHLRPDLAPKHVANFKKLVSEGYYDGLAVHRAIRGYLVQTGDPLTKDDSNKVNWGTGGPDYKIAPEIKGKHKRGSVAAARLNDSLNPDKNSSGSQFYMMLRSAKSLDGGYTVFADVTQGLDVLESVAAQVVDTNDVPVKRIEIKSIRLLAPAARELAPEKKGDRKTVPDSEKGPFTRFIERIW